MTEAATTNDALAALSAIVELTELLQQALEAHHPPEVANGFECDVCRIFGSLIATAHGDVHESLEVLGRNASR